MTRPPVDRSFAEVFAERAAHTPDALAVVAADRTLTYGELDAQATARARWLRARGVAEETVVGLAMDRSADTVAWVLGVLRAAAAFLPLDPVNPPERLRSLVSSARPDLVLASPDLEARTVDALPTGTVVTTEALTVAAAGGPLSRPHPLALAYVVHTSGSTREPKAVGVSHASLARCADGWLDSYGLRGLPMVHLQLAGFGFDVFTEDLSRCLLSGGTLVVAPPRAGLDPRRLADLIDRHGVEVAEFTPSLLLLLVEYLTSTGRRLTSLRTLVVGGEPWRAADFARVSAVAPVATVVNGYGLVESTIDNLAHVGAPAGSDLTAAMPLGVPHAGTEALVVDPVIGLVVDSGVGELYLAGACLGRGYLHQPGRTADRFVPHPTEPGARALRTGDLVRRDKTGALQYLGRIDDQQKVRGVRVSLDDVAAVLASHPGVVRASATVASTRAGNVLCGHVVVRDGGPSDDELWAFARDRLEPEAVPARLLRHAALPVNANGKLDRRALAATAEREVGVAAADLIEGDGPLRSVREAWHAVLGHPPAGPDDNFFAAGGDSLSAARLAVRLGVGAGAAIDASMVHHNPTPAALARELDAARGARWSVPRRPHPDRHPLTEGQRRLWLHGRLHPTDPTYTVPTEIGLIGPLDTAALGAALEAVVARHEPLRSVVRHTDDDAWLAVLPPGPVAVEVRAVVDESGGDRLIEEFVRRPFHLEHEPPLRCLLVRAARDRHRLVLAVHHIATDGESVRVMLRELGEAYDRAVRGEPATLAGPATTYGDLVHWRDAARPDADRAYWQERLRGAVDRPLLWRTPAPDVPRVRRDRVRLDAAAAGRVRAVARHRQTTVFATMLAAMAEIVSRWTGERAPCIGYPASRRDHPAAAELVGFFVDTMVARVDTGGAPSLHELATRTRAELAAAAARRGPFVDAAALADRKGPPFRVWFNHLGPPDEPPAMAGLRTSLRLPPAPGALFDLNVYVTEHDDGITVDMVHDEAAYAAEGAVELLGQYVALLAEASADPARPVQEHRAHTARAARLPDPEDPLPERPRVSPARHLAAVTCRNGGRTALRDAGGDCDRRTLDLRVRSAAAALRATGVRPGDTVAVYGRRSVGFVVGVLAVLRANGRVVVLDARHPMRRLRDHLVRSAARCVLLPTAADAPERLGWTGPVVHLGRTEPVMTGTPHLGHGEPLWDGAGYVAFTSGTTGEPTAVHSGLAPVFAFLDWYADAFALGTDDRFALLAGLGHDPVFRDILAPLWTGATLCVPDDETHLSPEALARWLAHERITVAHLTPPLARLILHAVPDGGLPALRLVCLGGDEVTSALVVDLGRAAPGATVVNGYGTTETPQLASYQVLDRREPVSLGRGAPGTQLLVVDADGRRCGIGQPGEIVVRSRQLVDGYLDGAVGFAVDPVPGVRRFRSGDRGRYRVDGTVEFLGRFGDLVKVRGHRVAPAEVDRVVRADDRVVTAATVTRAGPGGAELATHVVPRPGVVLTPTAVRELVARVLPRAAVPAAVFVVDALPLTANGKVDKAALAAREPQPRPASTVADEPHDAPVSPVERRLAGLCAAVLGLDRIGATDNFFDLGATSIQLISVHAAIRREVSRDLSLLALYANPNIRMLARCIAGSAAGAAGVDEHHRAPNRRPDYNADTERDRRLAARRALGS